MSKIKLQIDLIENRKRPDNCPPPPAGMLRTSNTGDLKFGTTKIFVKGLPKHNLNKGLTNESPNNMSRFYTTNQKDIKIKKDWFTQNFIHLR